MRIRARHLAVAIPMLLGGRPALAQGGPIGPCSPYAAADGDIASEMPGCARRQRPVPGSLADELEFRRARRHAGAASVPPGEVTDGEVTDGEVTDGDDEGADGSGRRRLRHPRGAW